MKKNNKCKHILALGIIIIVSILLIIYLSCVYLFQTRYFFRTTIDDIPSSGYKLETVERILHDKFLTYSLHVIGRENTEEIIRAEDVLLTVDTHAALQEVLNSQNPWIWPVSIWKRSSYEMKHIGQIDETALKEILSDISFMQRENMKRPKNAYIGEYKELTGEYELVEAYAGTLLKTAKVMDCIKQALENMDTELNLEEAGCYVEPSVTIENERLVQTCNELNKMVSSIIIYTFGDQEEVVDATLIQNWLEYTNSSVHLKEDEVAAYIKELAKKYDTAYRRHAFTTAEGVDIMIDSGFYGWRMNREEEKDALIDLISKGTVDIREPIYLQTAASYGEHDYGDTYVEINLTSQHLYFWESGNIIIETDFVSGNVAKGMGTPAGIFPITYKERNAVLKGENYATPVSYWMPFNGGIGMHDASWRKEFGGTIYQTNGSHGCINLPLEVAKEVYEHVQAGMPVICYYE